MMMNDGTIESIIREGAPEYARKMILAGNENYSALVMDWKGEDDGTGTSLIHIFDGEGAPVSVYELSEEQVRRAVRVIVQMHDAWIKPNSRPTRVITVEP